MWAAAGTLTSLNLTLVGSLTEGLSTVGGLTALTALNLRNVANVTDAGPT